MGILDTVKGWFGMGKEAPEDTAAEVADAGAQVSEKVEDVEAAEVVDTAASAVEDVQEAAGEAVGEAEETPEGQ